jgi:flagellar basal-body rod protein FlgG
MIDSVCDTVANGTLGPGTGDGNQYQATVASGEPELGTPGEGNAGSILQYALEGSNVDAAEELVNMITAQRGYELSSKVIQTADEMMQTAVSIRR